MRNQNKEKDFTFKKNRYGFIFVKKDKENMRGAMWDRKTDLIYYKDAIPKTIIGRNWQATVKYFKS